MGFANKTHWLGVFLLFAAAVLCVIASISAPVVNHISLLHVRLPNGNSINFGTFGYCLLGSNNNNLLADNTNRCSKSMIGYNAAAVIARADHTTFYDITSGTDHALTNVFVLHPVEAGLAFIAFLIACGAGIVGSFIGALVAAVTWILVLVSLAVDFTVFGTLHHHINDIDNSANATYGSGMWCLVAAFACLFFGMFIVFFTCCANRREKRRGTRSVKNEQVVDDRGTPVRRKRFGLF